MTVFLNFQYHHCVVAEDAQVTFFHRKVLLRCSLSLSFFFFLPEHRDSEDHMQHARGAGGGAGVPERRVAGEGEAVGGLERRPGR